MCESSFGGFITIIEYVYILRSKVLIIFNGLTDCVNQLKKAPDTI